MDELPSCSSSALSANASPNVLSDFADEPPGNRLSDLPSDEGSGRLSNWLADVLSDERSDGRINLDDLPSDEGSGGLDGLDDLPSDDDPGGLGDLDDLPGDDDSGGLSGLDDLPSDHDSGGPSDPVGDRLPRELELPSDEDVGELDRHELADPPAQQQGAPAGRGGARTRRLKIEALVRAKNAH